MLYSKGHGAKPTLSNPKMVNSSALDRTFRYLDPSVPEVSHNEDIVALLKDLGRAMVDPANLPDSPNGDVAPVMTYLGQFIDHDISAGTDRDIEIERKTTMSSMMTAGNFAPLPRDLIEQSTVNQATARLDLDSVYGDVVLASDFDRKFAAALRHGEGAFRGKMRISFNHLVPGQEVIPPNDKAGDLQRMANGLKRGDFTLAELKALPKEMAELFFLPDSNNNLGPLNGSRAIIGDMRNDENLFVSQLHLAVIRLHNRIVDACDDPRIQTGDELFEWAKKRVRWIYQWLVVNSYLPAICDAQTLQAVMSDEARLYTDFLNNTGGVRGKRLPLPMEFSGAAFRFGHSMARPEYDWNTFFSRDPGALTRATFELFFVFTGNGRNPMGGQSDDNLPSNWVADWSRLAEHDPAHELRAARRIDTSLSFELGKLQEKPFENSMPEDARNLAILNLLKGHILNLPSAQEVAAILSRSLPAPIKLLTADEITAGPIGTKIKDTILETQTPLWYYILKEAEVQNNGLRLGQLGSTIVASTLLGLVVNDPDSYWSQAGGDPVGRWQPEDTVQPSGVTIRSVPDLLRAALVL